MPQKLSLYTSLPDSDLEITFHTLYALTGMPPSPLFEHSLIWEPRHPYRPVMAAGQVNQIEQYRFRLTNDLIRVPVNLPPSLNHITNSKVDIDVEDENIMRLAVLPYTTQSKEAQEELIKREW